MRLRKFEGGLNGVELYGKAEWFNPGGSVKDRPAANMVREGLRSGALRPGKTLLDATSGNTGIAYAMIGAAEGFPREVVRARKRHGRTQEVAARLWRGADLTDPMDGSDGAIREARKQVAADADAYFYPDQYNNDANWRAHYETTGPEILAQTEGRITHFIAGLGTSGTFMGTGRRLREANSSIKLISFQPDSPLHGLEGLKHMETAIVPGIYDPSLADQDLRVKTEDAYMMVRRLAREEGLLVGISGGAALAGALKIAQTARNAVIVTIFPDSADKYMSERFWNLPA